MDLKELVKNNVKFNGKSIKDITAEQKQPDVEKSKFSIEISKIEIKDINDCKNDTEKVEAYEHNFKAMSKFEDLVRNKDAYGIKDNEAQILADAKLNEIADKINIELDMNDTFDDRLQKAANNILYNIVDVKERLEKEELLKKELKKGYNGKRKSDKTKSKFYELHNKKVNDKFDDIHIFIEGNTLEFTLDSANVEKFYNLRFQVKEDVIPDVVTARIDEFVSEYDGKKRCDMGKILKEIPHIFKDNGVPLQRVDFDINGVPSESLSKHIGMITDGLKECNAAYYSLNINKANKEFSQVELNNTIIDIDDKESNTWIYYNSDTNVKLGQYVPTELTAECLTLNKPLKDKMMSKSSKVKDDMDK